jgi:hypothetical protein
MQRVKEVRGRSLKMQLILGCSTAILLLGIFRVPDSLPTLCVIVDPPGKADPIGGYIRTIGGKALAWAFPG